MKEFILIFRHQDGNKIASAEQINLWTKQTKEWLSKIDAKKKLIAGNGLAFENSRVVKSNSIVFNEPFGNVRETIGGYVIVKADSVDDAVEMAKACPVLQGKGNTVEVRQIVPAKGK